MNRNSSFQRRTIGQQQQQNTTNKQQDDSSTTTTIKSTSNNNNNNNKVIAQDHDDEAEDQVMARNPRDWPFPSFEPAGQEAIDLQRQKYKTAKKALKELANAPAVVAIQAPLETDRPAWKTANTFRHEDPPPLDLRTEKPKSREEKTSKEKRKKR